ncbi:conserved hypothetical protein [Pirellula staleyi DSM 6068]|uniref:DUF1475 domain-containing protein n=1 Tax=Pirellula staleyi (strain ATCC 27377 / DSM 6068 / ICPB 4128) TaxID=530564 RepID=D2R4B0_PIRSD|nr:DUF1475 family protein [Pirellula staleyi]ADB15258.1 conserved hypothetical protein [Pirellula staleyi DSM 6068]
MRTTLILIFSLFFVTLLAITVRATLLESITAVPSAVVSDPWFIATLADAYLSFLTFYCWVFYKERSWLARLGWLVAILLLGNMAISLYMLIAVIRLAPGDGPRELLLRQSAA